MKWLLHMCYILQHHFRRDPGIIYLTHSSVDSPLSLSISLSLSVSGQRPKEIIETWLGSVCRWNHVSEARVCAACVSGLMDQLIAANL